ncbi:MAG: hypothetical protein KatS3mg030_174 [Saprospiraceae bacterium]|nr:MAG: hypothetical protein KatS3mg030_174 [Saprospiraceae bacterium]
MDEKDKRAEEEKKRIQEMLRRINLKTDRSGKLTSNLDHEQIRAYLETKERARAQASDEEE